ncbi:response regulator [Chloroflexota bacterium]
MERIRVLVVDDHVPLRGEVVEILSQHDELEVVGEAADGAEAVEKARSIVPDVVVMDLRMPGVSGLEATALIRTELPSVQVLVFTVSESEADLFAAMRYGAKGYIVKSARADELVRAILHVVQGGVIVSPPMAIKLLADLDRVSVVREQLGVPLESLSSEEMDVLRMVSLGVNDTQIARVLRITEEAVQMHLRHIMDRLHLTNRDQATAYAEKVGLQILRPAAVFDVEKAREEVEKPTPVASRKGEAIPVTSIVGFGATVALAAVASHWYLMGDSALPEATIAGMTLQEMERLTLFPSLPLLLVTVGSLLSALLAILGAQGRPYPVTSIVVGLASLFGASWLWLGLVLSLPAGMAGFDVAETGPMLATIGTIILVVGAAITAPPLSRRYAK